MGKRILPSAERLRELLDYDPATGKGAKLSASGKFTQTGTDNIVPFQNLRVNLPEGSGDDNSLEGLAKKTGQTPFEGKIMYLPSRASRGTAFSYLMRLRAKNEAAAAYATAAKAAFGEFARAA